MRRMTILALVSFWQVGVAIGGEQQADNVVLGIHGGTGMDKKEMTAEIDKRLRAGLKDALNTGNAALKKPGATSLDAVEAAIRVLEDNPLFNAGKGAVFTDDGRNELDASIMEGKSLEAGSVAGVTTVKNPITAARAVMEKTKHVMLIGRGAEQFATEAGLEIVDPKYFWTELRWKQLEQRRKKEVEKAKDTTNQSSTEKPRGELGTVGAVAVDAFGNLAAGTSTGGMTMKKYGRVGDSPIIGAGTYADNDACAVSATGHGEYFIRHAVAHSIVALMKYRNVGVHDAANLVINETLKDAGGEGAVIALDPKGRFSMSFNSEGLYRGYITRDGKITVALYED